MIGYPHTRFVERYCAVKQVPVMVTHRHVISARAVPQRAPMRAVRRTATIDTVRLYPVCESAARYCDGVGDAVVTRRASCPRESTVRYYDDIGDTARCGCTDTAARRCDLTASDTLPLTMGYVPRQDWSRTYELDTALRRGTYYPALDKPFEGSRGDVYDRR